MKLLVSIILTLILIISGGLGINHELQKSTDDLITQINQISQLITDSKWQDAVDQTQKLEEIWEKEGRWWPIFLDHQEMDNIEFSLAKFKEYVAAQDNALSLGQLSEIRMMVEHIPEKEKVNLKHFS